MGKMLTIQIEKIEVQVPNTHIKSQVWLNTLQPRTGGGKGSYRQILKAHWPASLVKMANSKFIEKPVTKYMVQRQPRKISPHINI